MGWQTGTESRCLLRTVLHRPCEEQQLPVARLRRPQHMCGIDGFFFFKVLDLRILEDKVRFNKIS